MWCIFESPSGSRFWVMHYMHLFKSNLSPRSNNVPFKYGWSHIVTLFSIIAIVKVNRPQNVILSQESSSSLQVTWDHPCDGPPATHYLITIICVQFDIAVSTNQQHSLTVARENTSAIVEDLSLIVGNVYAVVVTSVFNSVSAASELVPIHIRMLYTWSIYTILSQCIS